MLTHTYDSCIFRNIRFPSSQVCKFYIFEISNILSDYGIVKNSRRLPLCTKIETPLVSTNKGYLVVSAPQGCTKKNEKLLHIFPKRLWHQNQPSHWGDSRQAKWQSWPKRIIQSSVNHDSSATMLTCNIFLVRCYFSSILTDRPFHFYGRFTLL